MLYGLNWAKEHIVHEGEAIVCEGYTDVIGFATAGVPRAVATCGTALTEDHIRLLKRFTNRIVLAFDADAAGQNAAARVYEWEKVHEVEFAVADLPSGVDPADLAREDPERLAAAIAEARPFLGFRVERVLAGGDVRTPESRARTAEAALAVVREHPSELVRDQYVMAIADRCRIDPDRLRELLRSGGGGAGAAERDAGRGGRHGRRHGGREQPRSATGGRAVLVDRRAVVSPMDTAEDEALRLLLHQRDDIVDRLDAVLFNSPRRRAAYDILVVETDLHAALELASDDVRALISRLAVEEPHGDPDQVVADLARYAATREIDALRADAAAAQTPDDLRGIVECIDWLRHRVEELERPDSRDQASGVLVAWLADHGEGRADG